MGFCASRGITRQPDFDGRLSFGNVRCGYKIVLLKGPSRRLLHAAKGRWESKAKVTRQDYGWVRVDGIDQKSLEQIYTDICSGMQKMQNAQGRPWLTCQISSKTTATSSSLTFRPCKQVERASSLLEPYLFLVGYISCNIGIDLSWLGVQRRC